LPHFSTQNNISKNNISKNNISKKNISKSQELLMQLSPSRIFLPLALSATFFIPAARAQDDEIETPGDTTAATQATLKAILSNKDVPLSLKMKEMNGKWRRFIVNAPNMNAEMEAWGAKAGVEFGVHFTKGQTVIMGEDTFLIAYRLPVNIDPRFLNWHGHGDAPRPRKPDEETTLNLSLLNLSTMNALKDVRPFDAKTDMESVSQINAASVRTLTSLGQGMMRYIRARGVFPTLNNPIDFDAKRFFYPYVGDERLFCTPARSKCIFGIQPSAAKKPCISKTSKAWSSFLKPNPAATARAAFSSWTAMSNGCSPRTGSA